jgi:hypothetical protein
MMREIKKRKHLACQINSLSDLRPLEKLIFLMPIWDFKISII